MVHGASHRAPCLTSSNQDNRNNKNDDDENDNDCDGDGDSDHDNAELHHIGAGELQVRDGILDPVLHAQRGTTSSLLT